MQFFSLPARKACGQTFSRRTEETEDLDSTITSHVETKRSGCFFMSQRSPVKVQICDAFPRLHCSPTSSCFGENVCISARTQILEKALFRLSCLLSMLLFQCLALKLFSPVLLCSSLRSARTLALSEDAGRH